jgi:hypothetical protein
MILRRSALSFVALLPAVLMLTGPLQAGAGGSPQGFSFAAKGTITLDVAQIEVISPYTPPLAAPHVEHRIAVSPSDAVRLWTADRLKAGGQNGTARIIIRDASVKETSLPRTEGVRGWFTKDQSEQYEGRLTVEIQVSKPNGFSGTVTASTSRSTSVAEDVSLAEREQAMLALVQGLIADLDSQLDPEIKATLFPVVIL